MPNPLRVLILEDRPTDAELFLHELRRAGFDPEWQRVETEEEYLAALQAAWDIIISDYSLPQFDGPSALRLLRARGLDLPFILVSGTVGEDIAVSTMKEGADDYLLKDRLTRLGSAVKSALDQKRLRDERKQAEATLKESEEYFRSLIENVSDVITAIDSAGTILYESPSIERVLGYKPEELQGQNAFELVHPEERADTAEAFARGLQSPESSPLVEARFRHKDGSWRVMEMIGKPALGRAGQVIGIVNARDITERKQAERELAERSRLLEALFTNHLTCLVLLDPDFNFIRVNEAYARAAGRDVSEFPGHNHFEFYPSEARALFEDVVGTKKPFQVSARPFVYADHPERGVTYWDWTLVPILDHTGKVEFLVFSLNDVSERKQAEEALRESEERLRVGLRTANIAVFNQDTDLRYVWMYQPQLGYAVEQVIGHTDAELLPLEAAKQVMEIKQHVLESGLRERAEVPISVGGQTFVYDLVAEPLRDVSGAIIGLTGASLDITERKQAEQELVKLQKAVDNSGEVVFMTDRDGLITFVNPEFTRLYGYAAEEVVGQITPRILKSGLVPPEGYAALWQTILNKQLAKGEFVNKTKDGRLLNIEGSVNPILDDGGNIAGFLAIQRDITERKQAEEALQNSEARYRVLFEQSPNGVLLMDLDTGKTIEANETAHKQLGYTREEFAALRISDYEVLEKPEDTARHMQKIIREGNDDFETLHRTKSGEIRNIHVWAKTVQVSDRALFHAIFQDITERKRDEAQIMRQLQHITGLRTIDTAITSSFDLRLTLGVVLDQVTAQLNVDAADVLLFNPHLQTLEFAAARGFRTKAFKGAQLRLGEGYAGRAALERHSVHIPNLDNQHDNPRLAKHLASEGFVAYYGLPLFAKGQVKGVLEVFQRAPLAAGPDWVNFLETLARQAAIAIDNTQLFDNLERSNVELSLAYDTTLEGWSHALDLRDKETEGHTQRVTEISQRLARVMGIDEAELVNMRRGALLHDIGKMGVSDGILHKSGPLTDEEWVAMKKHPTFAYEMLAPITYLHAALEIPYCHHEKWDGTGYPRGLKGEQIPLSARIFAIVDVWDALTSDRPYRKAWPEEKVREHILAGSGTHFDPQVVEVFLKMPN